jgi:hypothetical protein
MDEQPLGAFRRNHHPRPARWHQCARGRGVISPHERASRRRVERKTRPATSRDDQRATLPSSLKVPPSDANVALVTGSRFQAKETALVHPSSSAVIRIVRLGPILCVDTCTTPARVRSVEVAESASPADGLPTRRVASRILDTHAKTTGIVRDARPLLSSQGLGVRLVSPAAAAEAPRLSSRSNPYLGAAAGANWLRAQRRSMARSRSTAAPELDNVSIEPVGAGVRHRSQTGAIAGHDSVSSLFVRCQFGVASRFRQWEVGPHH